MAWANGERQLKLKCDVQNGNYSSGRHLTPLVGNFECLWIKMLVGWVIDGILSGVKIVGNAGGVLVAVDEVMKF
jgi:hypothetical protein